MSAWRAVFREYVELLRERAGGDVVRVALLGLCDALRNDDEALIQGTITSPSPVPNAFHLPVTACDPVVFLGHACRQIDTGAPAGILKVGQAERWFAGVCQELDDRLGCPRASGALFLFWDETPRHGARALLLPEVEHAVYPLLPDPEVGPVVAALPVPARAPCPF